jgi:uncharacterized membrane protein
MQTLREKITFVLTALAYLVFHVRTGPTLGSIISGTVEQLLTTAPYCIGFTFVLVAIIRYMHDGKRPAWDRIARIYFTIGILFAFYFALYEYGGRAHQEQLKREAKPATESLLYRNESPRVPLYWA